MNLTVTYPIEVPELEELRLSNKGHIQTWTPQEGVYRTMLFWIQGECLYQKSGDGSTPRESQEACLGSAVVIRSRKL